MLKQGLSNSFQQINLQQRDILFALHPEKQTFFSNNYCLFVAMQYIYSAYSSCFEKQAQDRQTEESRPQLLYSQSTFFTFGPCVCILLLLFVD